MADIIIEFRDMALFVITQVRGGTVVLFPQPGHTTRIADQNDWNAEGYEDVPRPFEFRILRNGQEIGRGPVAPPSGQHAVNMAAAAGGSVSVDDAVLYGDLLDSLNGRMLLPGGRLTDGPSEVKDGYYADKTWTIGATEQTLTECMTFSMTADDGHYQLVWPGGARDLTPGAPLYIFNGDRSHPTLAPADFTGGERLTEFAMLSGIAGAGDIVPSREGQLAWLKGADEAGGGLPTYTDRPCPVSWLVQR